MILLDTHALLWHLFSPNKLSTKARKYIEQEIKAGSKILVSSVSVWETFLLAKKGKIVLGLSSDSWLKKVEQISYLRFIPLNNSIAAKSVTLPDFDHKDPADRFILATALEYGAKLVTSDQKLRNYPHVQAIT